MNYYITYGTQSFLHDLLKGFEDPQGEIFLMDGRDKSALIHKTEGDSLFESGHAYEPIEEKGGFENAGFVVFNNIPVASDGQDLFEQRFQQRAGLVEDEPGCVGLLILRPKDTNTYIVASMWEDEKDFENWRESPSYQKAHQKRDTSEALPQNLFLNKPYIRTFHYIQSK